MGVDTIHSLKNLKRNLNQKQKDYLSNVFAVSGGAIIYTIWQGMFPFPVSISVITFMQYFVMSIFGILMIFAGILVHSKDTK